MSDKAGVSRNVFLALILFAGAAHGADFFTGLSAGYKGGISVCGSAGMSSFAQGFPLGLEFGLTYSRIDPGDPFPARRIFIADATNGTPEKSGLTWDFRMDFLYNLRVSGPKGVFLFAGPRLSLFTGSFHYVGANEEFDVTSTQWGLGFGGKGLFAISYRVDLMLSAGFDYYFKGPLHGHDTTYSPDDQNGNPKENFIYTDAAAVINTPKLQPTMMIGLAYSF